MTLKKSRKSLISLITIHIQINPTIIIAAWSQKNQSVTQKRKKGVVWILYKEIIILPKDQAASLKKQIAYCKNEEV